VVNGIKIQGLDKILKTLQDAEQDVIEEVDMELQAASFDMERLAKNAAPVNIGFLKNNISSSKVGDLAYEFVSQADYSAYVEFGTKTYVRVPKGLESYAAQFRGKGKGKLSLVEAIKKWLERKEGIKGKELERRARFIAFIIAKKGIKPQPFFFPAYFTVRPQLLNRLKQIVNEKRG
jgi:HK97 gp10 family phage protein